MTPNPNSEGDWMLLAIAIITFNLILLILLSTSALSEWSLDIIEDAVIQLYIICNEVKDCFAHGQGNQGKAKKTISSDLVHLFTYLTTYVSEDLLLSLFLSGSDNGKCSI